jgi:hypothetical protein
MGRKGRKVIGGDGGREQEPAGRRRSFGGRSFGGRSFGGRAVMGALVLSFRLVDGLVVAAQFFRRYWQLVAIASNPTRFPPMMTFRFAALAGLLLLGNAGAQAQLSLLNDEFDNPGSLANWQRIYAVEGWGANQLELQDVSTSRAGWMTMMPYTSSWYADWRGELTFKSVTGDFVVTTHVETANRAMNAAPGRIYSLAGIMVRAPRAITNPAVDWAPGGENYVFLSHGAANTAGTYQFEVKTTDDSVSVLEISSAGVDEATIQVARLGTSFIMLYRVGAGPWVVHRRYSRTDMPATLQAGMTVYTDWDNVSPTDPFTHNSTVYTGGQPDLMAWFDYYRFAEPVVPGPLVGLDFSNPGQVTDGDLLSFLGDNANAGPSGVADWRLLGDE